LDQVRFLKRQLSFPVSTMSQWRVSRSKPNDQINDDFCQYLM